MPDIGEKATEREYKRLRAKIRDVYQQAYEEIYQKNLDFVRRHEQKERQYRQMVAEGRISQADFDAWMRGQVFQGRMWEAQRKQMQETLYHADEIALQMVNDSRYSVFADNANYIGYTLEKDARVMTSFGLYDADSVRRLLKEEPYLLPPRKLAGRDKSYQWYNRQIQTAITQGIIQGEPLKDIAKRIGQQTGETDMNAMLRNARTMQTGAQNAGRIEGMHQAQRLGINVKKQWMATLDSHTRDAHQALDGQIAEVDKPFKSELGDIMYPGDQTAKPANVWNCRCTLVSVYPEYPDEMMKRRDNETGEIIDNMTYREWEEMKRSRRAEPEPEPETNEPVYDEKTQQFVDMLHERIEPVEVQQLPNPLTPEQIIERVGGGDKTRGSCASLCLAYAGNKAGYDVLDFRGGKSQEFFSGAFSRFSKLPGLDTKVISANNSVKAAKELLEIMITGKEYILETGEHAAIVRRTDRGVFQYLELQRERGNGWRTLNDYVLKERFNAKTRRTVMGLRPDDDSRLIDVDSLPNNPAFREILSFINTNEDDQKKGRGGYAK